MGTMLSAEKSSEIHTYVRGHSDSYQVERSLSTPARREDQEICVWAWFRGCWLAPQYQVVYVFHLQENTKCRQQRGGAVIYSCSEHGPSEPL